MNTQRMFLCVLLAVFVVPAPLPGQDFAASGTAIELFNGKDLSGFYTFLKNHGKSNDPDHIFNVENGVIHVSGAEFGYIATDKEYKNYRLTC